MVVTIQRVIFIIGNLVSLTFTLPLVFSLVLTENVAVAGVLATGGLPNAAHASLELWLDASTLNSSTTSVTVWEDQSANTGRDAVSSGSNAPTYIASNAAFSGRASVRFDGGDFLSTVSGGVMGIDGNKDRTIFFVFAKHNGTQSSNILGYGSNSPNQLFDIALVDNETISLHSYSSPWLASSPTFTVNQMTVGSVSYSGSTIETFKHDQDGSGIGTASRTLNTGSSESFVIGNGKYPNYNNFVGDIAEVLVFSEALSAADFSAIDNYLYTKYTTAPSAVPEPSTVIAMALLGIVGFAGNRRRRRQVSAA